MEKGGGVRGGEMGGGVREGDGRMEQYKTFIHIVIILHCVSAFMHSCSKK